MRGVYILFGHFSSNLLKEVQDEKSIIDSVVNINANIFDGNSDYCTKFRIENR